MTKGDKQFDYLAVSEREFASAIGIGQRSINYYLKREQKPSFELIVKIASAYPDISPAWLLTGKGEMQPKNTPVEVLNIDYKDKYLEAVEEISKLRKQIIEILQEQKGVLPAPEGRDVSTAKQKTGT